MGRIQFSVDETPVSKQATQRGRHNMYQPQKTRSFESRVRAASKEYMERHGLTKFDEPVVVWLVFRQKVPSSWSIKKQHAALDGEIAHTGRRDLDNMTKAFWDGMKKVVMTDDRLVVELHTLKKASKSAGIDVVVESYAEARTRERGWEAGMGGEARSAAQDFDLLHEEVTRKYPVILDALRRSELGDP